MIKFTLTLTLNQLRKKLGFVLTTYYEWFWKMGGGSHAHNYIYLLNKFTTYLYQIKRKTLQQQLLTKGYASIIIYSVLSLLLLPPST